MENKKKHMIVCGNCGKRPYFMCERCEEPYCSQKCRDLDWIVHKHYCIVKPPLIAIPVNENQAEELETTRQEPAAAKQKTEKKIDKRPDEVATTTDHLFTVNPEPEYADIFFINDLVQTKLTIGQEISVTVVDKSMLDEKMVSVYERFKGYSKFYKKLNNLVDTVAKSQPNLDFLPAEGQLVLAPYKTKYYRAVALASDYRTDKVHLFYLDFGNVDLIKSKKIRKFPMELLFNYCCNMTTLIVDDADMETLKTLIQTKSYIKITVVESNSEFNTAIWKKP